jgi:hypothetical protein
MIRGVMIYAGSIIIILWGIAHILPMKFVVRGFGPISRESKRIITMEWIAEGLTLCFIGILVLLITILGGYRNSISVIVYRSSAIMLFIMAILTLLTGARTSIIAIRFCPLVKTAVAVMFYLGTVL